MAVGLLGEYRFDCHECDDTLKKERGCISKGILPFYIGDERVYRCPIKMVNDISYEYIRAYSFYKRNLLPNGISWLNESQKFLDAMIVLDNEINKGKDNGSN